MTAGDFSGNGRLDLAVLDSSGTVSILMGNGDGTFQPGAYYTVAQQCRMAIVDGGLQRRRPARPGCRGSRRPGRLRGSGRRLDPAGKW